MRAAQTDAYAGGVSAWLSLAAAPTFALMALLTSVLGGGAPAMLCSTMHDGSPLGGMAPMYLLMSAFHSMPWLKLISRRRLNVSTGCDPSSHAGPSRWTRRPTTACGA